VVKDAEEKLAVTVTGPPGPRQAWRHIRKMLQWVYGDQFWKNKIDNGMNLLQFKPTCTQVYMQVYRSDCILLCRCIGVIVYLVRRSI